MRNILERLSLPLSVIKIPLTGRPPSVQSETRTTADLAPAPRAHVGVWLDEVGPSRKNVSASAVDLDRARARHPWDIRVGRFTGNFYARFAPRRVPGLIYLGTIRRGLQLGALAINERGDYVQANGDMIQKLKTASVERAIQSLSSFDRSEIKRLLREGRSPQARRRFVR